MDKKRKQASGSQPVHHGKVKLSDVSLEGGLGARNLDETNKFEKRLKYQNQLPPIRSTYEPHRSKSSYLDIARKRHRDQTLESERTIQMVDDVMDEMKAMHSKASSTPLVSTAARSSDNKTGKPRSSLTVPRSSLPGIATKNTSSSKRAPAQSYSSSRQSRIPKISREKMAGNSELAGSHLLTDSGEVDVDLLIEELRHDKSGKFYYLRSSSRTHPFRFKIVPFDRSDKTNLFTISSTGFMCNKLLCTESYLVPLEEWAAEYEITKQLMQLKTFGTCQFSKFFYKWRNSLRWGRYQKAKAKVAREAFLLDDIMQLALQDIYGALQEILALCFYEKTLRSFSSSAKYDKPQERLDLDVYRKYQDICISSTWEAIEEQRSQIHSVIVAMFQRLLQRAGFTVDDKYPQQPPSSPVPAGSSAMLVSSSNVFQRPATPENFQFSRVLKKKEICDRVARFILRIDYVMQTTLKELLENSMRTFLEVVDRNLQYLPPQAVLEGDEIDRILEEERPDEPKSPLFLISISTSLSDFVFRPLQRDFISAKDEIIARWFSLTLNMSNFMTSPALNPVLQPILRGEKCHYRLGGNGPSFKKLLDEKYEGLMEPWPFVSNNKTIVPEQSPESSKTLLERLRGDLDERFSRNSHALDVYVRRFEDIRTSFKDNAFEDKTTFQGEKRIEEYRDLMEKYETQVSNLNKLVENQPLGLYLLQMQNLTQILIPKAELLLQNLKQILPEVGKKRIARLTEKLIAAQSYLDHDPEETSHLMEYLAFLDSVVTQVELLDQDLSYCKDLYALIEEFGIKYPFEDKTSYMVVTDLLHNLHSKIDSLVADRDKLMGETFQAKIHRDIENLMDRIADIRTKAEDPSLLSLELPTSEALEKLDILLAELDDCQENANSYKSYQKKFGVEATEYPLLTQLIPDVRNRRKLRTCYTEWQDKVLDWHTCPFQELDPDEMTTQVKTYGALVASLEKTLPPNPMVAKLKQSVEQMKEKLAVITALRNPALEPRHLEAIEALLGTTLDLGSMTLSDVEAAGVFEHEDEISEISGRASSESALKTLLEKIEATWKNLEFICVPHRGFKNTYILAGIEEIQVSLDESLISLATILSSRQVSQIKESAEQWRSKLFLFSRTMDEWTGFQSTWIYLESIFSGPDIQKQLPSEGRLFAEVTKFWKETMKRTAEKPQAFSTVTSPEFLPALVTNSQMMEKILKNLECYLDVKRASFPRFYFLSNEELLEILGQARNPQAVQPHLGKCFDGITALEFGTKKLKPQDPTDPNEEPRTVPTSDIVAMISPEKEVVRLGKGLSARGSVEDWLVKVERSMFMTLRRLMKAALLDFTTRKRTDWVLRHAAQIVLTISQVMWCADITEILNPEHADSKIDARFKAFEEKCFRELNDMAGMVRGELTPLQRATLCALITIDVHARDIVSSMVRNRVRDPGAFEWLKQLRYYWDEEIDNCVGKMAFATFVYGYEYLGASPRLVITPLTDKCYLCLMGALQLKLGGAPAGPAGTGKTETTKDLAKSLAIQCVVFNCSDTLDYKIMGRLLGGMAQSGAWICFDEFNRIDIEVLSVVAQQLISITNAKMAGVGSFLFEGKMIRLIASCAAFITMNPGYAGRTELPDNLKTLFRPMAMMVPDYGLIAEVVLYSEGFEASKHLARKMVNMYKLCSEQLSQQDHYDFGMRAVKSVLVMAGSLKRANPERDEEVVLLRALRDSNLPKFLADDAGLFMGILNDLFPGIVLPLEDYGSFQQAMEAVMREHNLQLEPGSFVKTIQLYETMLVRHGVMTVGPTGGGKTTVTNILQWTLTRLFESGVPGAFYRPVHTYTLNPKSVTSGELYGETNPATMEWKDGLIGIFTRLAVQSTKDEHQWVICDGPIDAVWIENMNSVLDDNKLLCLANSERIKLTSKVHMMFEVQDLSQASPATVSRCGMVYVDPSSLGWKPYVKSWLDRLFEKISLIKEEFQDSILALFEEYVNPGLQFLRKHCAVAIYQVDVSKARMICSLMESSLLEPGMLDRSHPSQNTASLLVRVFAWSYLWSVGGNLTDESQDKFEAFVRDQFSGNPHLSASQGADLRSFYVSTDTQDLAPWTAITPGFVYNPAMSFFDMMVPTVLTVRYASLMEKLLLVNHPVMFTGVTGVGKTAIARSTLTKLMGTNSWAALTINFSAQTSSSRAQDILEGKLDKRTKTLLGAPLGKRLAVFVDDVNMPKLETYGAQPPIELLRQFLDFGGLYDREKMFWKRIEDVVLCAGCAPPGGGRNPLTPRFVRHFGLLAIPQPSEDALKVIFKSILSGFLSTFPPGVQAVADPIINTAVEVYNRIAEDLLPTPAKSHYVFNLRDLSKCVQGVLQASSGSVKTADDIFRLYYHESLRVFHDRLINAEDKGYFYRLMKQACSRHLGTPVLEFNDPTVAQDPPVLLFGDFMSGAVKEDRTYQEIKSVEKLKQALDDFLSNYNLTYSKDMPLLFFMDAISHVTRIARILRAERGNALLVGLSGMGKQSLTILASHINTYGCHQIELTRTYDYNAFHEDLRRFYLLAGAQGLDTVFLLTDTQILQEEFLEDVNNILNSGEVPNLFEAEEYEKVQTQCGAAAKEAGLTDRDAVYEFFIGRVRNKLHVVLSMSPVGDNFRRRCRMFPSLVNCCTIDWFVDWPQEALESVANNTLKSLENVDLVKKLSAMCYTIHESVEKMTHRYYEEVRKHYYVTPSSYLEMLRQYLGLLDVNMDKVKGLKDRIENGLNKIAETNQLVATMQDKLTRMEPELKEKSEATAALMVSLAREKAAASQVQQVVAADEAVVKVKAAETQAIADDAQKDLAAALPALEAATAALEALNKGDIGEMKGFLNPPELVQYVLEAVLILLGYKQTDWTTAKVAMGDSDFLRKLQTYDKDNVPDSILNKLKPYIESPKFDPEKVAAQSKVAKSLCVWVRAVDMYCKVAKEVEPKRRSLETAERELAQIMSILRAKQQSLAEVEAQIANLEATYDASLAAKAELENAMILGKARLGRAGRLTNALADEEVRWKELVVSYSTEMNNMVGDVLIGSACVAYLGAFTSTYRTELCSSWLQTLSALGIPASPSFSLVRVLADPFEIRTWNSFGLPRDSVSTENAIICTRSRKWPLMIDPQEQASRWIRNMESPNGLKILKLTDPTYMRIMEASLRLGLPVLLEDVGEYIDPALGPILLKQTVTKGGRTLIKLGDTFIDYDLRFRLYLTSKLPNPHYLPETCIQICLMDFTVTARGLEDQLMADVVRLERPDLEKERLQLIATMNKDKAMLKEIEDNILRLLFTSKGNILDNEELINTLNESKVTSTAIAERLIVAEETDAAISLARDKYRSIAQRGSCLYFVVACLADIDPMYQFSLKYFNALFVSVIEKSERESDVEKRIQLLLNAITVAAYNNVSRGLFERHKLVYSFMLCAAIQRQAKSLPEVYWNYLLRGPLGSTGTPPLKPSAPKLTEPMWTQANYLASAFPNKFKSLPSVCTQKIELSVGDFHLVIHLDESNTRPVDVNFEQSLDPFEKLMLIKCLKEEKLVFGVTEYVAVSLGKVFCESPSINLHEMFKDMSKTTPLVFVLSPGSDPFGNFQRFATEMGYGGDRVHAISLGQGQGRIAEQKVEKAAHVGDWVFLQNCHVASSWLMALERLVLALAEGDDEVHRDFRLFMSSMPSPKFPVSILQNSVKVTNEPPKGIRSNVKRSLAGSLDEALFNSHSLGAAWRSMVFGLCFFHAVIQERKKFGPLGWSILYEFNDSDLGCALGTLHMYCARDTIPWEALTYTFGEVNYGGRVTDVWDQRTLRTILLSYFGAHTLRPGYVYSQSGTYYCPETPECNTLDGYKAFIEDLPIIDMPEIFGMHDNANIAFQMKETKQVMKTILDVQPREGSGSGDKSPDEIVSELCDVLVQRIKTKIDKDNAHDILQKRDEKGRLPSLTTVLMQETDRFNAVLANIHTSLQNLKKAITGFIVMNEQLEEVYNSFLNNQVPKLWSAKCYPSLKSLGSWIKDLVLRIDFISVWLAHGPPVSFWLPGFFFPQGFMTGCLQTHARRQGLAIDTLRIDFRMTGVLLSQEDIEATHRRVGGEEASCYKSLSVSSDAFLVHGLFLDAADYDVISGSLVDPKPGVIHPPLPAMGLCPTLATMDAPVVQQTAQDDKDTGDTTSDETTSAADGAASGETEAAAPKVRPPQDRYTCPLYKTSARAGTLSTTGHSTNFVTPVVLPSYQPEQYWVLKGAALLTQITD